MAQLATENRGSHTGHRQRTKNFLPKTTKGAGAERTDQRRSDAIRSWTRLRNIK
jgi:hypothetical protein